MSARFLASIPIHPSSNNPIWSESYKSGLDKTRENDSVVDFKLVVGFTATPKRGDGVGLDAVFQEIVFSRSLPEMIQAGFLSPVAGYRVETETDLAGVPGKENVTPVAGVGPGRGGYRLGLTEGRVVLVLPTILGEWEVQIRQKGSDEAVLSRPDLPSAISEAEGFVARRFSDLLPLVRLDTRWRRAPATEKQLGILQSRKIEVPKGITKGQASHLIGMLSCSLKPS